ncbi:nucleotidyl transferase AbiEii/AbiGii toxin family protein [Albibacterium bauzanense]|uniref:Nucleotidyltransferase AbiEii toxin of type IV toxin-antitoxin system n=1 Tax=Albibacterium bauzanense TaxID=653929 RepID=A0A4R1M5P5_9SPHI|nr:nucleotidyl transferase AbiEii/AbiGii toxin family protein [Albibacterium bauzanense]TCK85073.1 nucleotidyltransferase AbiEii toxin of type IV toxin-antitoxin system [Albibacterium bauzanense]
MLYWNTVNNLLKDTLITLMQSKEFLKFRLVGGTALSLQLGHRMSVDIDFFTDASYRSIDFDAIEDFLNISFGYVQGDFGGNPGIGKSYLVGPDINHITKLDVYYAIDPFFQQAIVEDNIRMATIEEIIAMKVDIVQRGGRKKDFWDLHEVLDHYSISEMKDLHRQRFEWSHDEALIHQNFTEFEAADDEPDPICLKNKEWIFIKEDIEQAVNASL